MLGDLLITFFAVARQGSVTAAARALKLSQPTVTGRIRQLEESYGIELFHRRGSRLELSDVGVALMPHAERFAQHGSEVDFLLRNAGNLQSGNLRIGATGPYYILRSVAAFRERYPAIEPSLEIGNSQQILQALFEYRIDLAVSSRVEEDPRVARMLLASDPIVAVMHPEHPLARESSIGLAQLAHCRLLVREPGSMTRDALETALERAGLELPPHMVIGSREAICEAIRLDLGVSVLPRGEVPDDPALRMVPFAHDAPVLHEYLYCLEARRRSSTRSSRAYGPRMRTPPGSFAVLPTHPAASAAALHRRRSRERNGCGVSPARGRTARLQRKVAQKNAVFPAVFRVFPACRRRVARRVCARMRASLEPNRRLPIYQWGRQRGVNRLGLSLNTF